MKKQWNQFLLMFQAAPLERFHPPTKSRENHPVVWKSVSQNIPTNIPFICLYDVIWLLRPNAFYNHVIPKISESSQLSTTKKKSSFPETRRKSSVQSHEGRVRPNESVQRRQGFDPYQLCQRNWRDNWPQRTRLGKQNKNNTTTQWHVWFCCTLFYCFLVATNSDYDSGHFCWEL